METRAVDQLYEIDDAISPSAEILAKMLRCQMVWDSILRLIRDDTGDCSRQKLTLAHLSDTQGDRGAGRHIQFTESWRISAARETMQSDASKSACMYLAL